MTRDEMRTMFLTCLGMKDGDMDGADIDVYLQKIYQYEITNKIGEQFSGGFVDQTPVAGWGYAVPFVSLAAAGSRIRSITGPAFLLNAASTEIEIITDVREFYQRYPTETDGDPLAALIYAKTVLLRPVPTASTPQVRYYCQLHPEAFGAGGLVDNSVCFCIVHGAVRQYAQDTGRDEVAAQYKDEYRLDLAEVASSYNSGYRRSSPPGENW